MRDDAPHTDIAPGVVPGQCRIEEAIALADPFEGWGCKRWGQSRRDRGRFLEACGGVIGSRSPKFAHQGQVKHWISAVFPPVWPI
jgi:hypothetical protein